MPAFCFCRDDVVFHDDIVTLLPLYWNKVPRSFEFIFVGQVYPWGEQPDTIANGEQSTACWRNMCNWR